MGTTPKKSAGKADPRFLPGQDSESNLTDLDQTVELDVTDSDQPESADPFTDLFGPIDDGQIFLRIWRAEPKYFNGERIGGYSGIVPHGEGLEWIAENKGGGTYKIQQYVNKKYVQSRHLFIAGPPRISPPFAPAVGAAGQPKPPAPDQKQPDDDTTFWKNLRQMMVERSILKSFETPPISDQLISALLERQAPVAQVDPLEAAARAIENISAIRERLGGPEPAGESGDGLISIFSKALDILPKLAAARQPLPQLKRPTPNPAPAPQLPAPLEIPPTAQEVEPVSIFQIAQAAIGTTVQAFLEEPPFTAEQTVETLKAIVPMSAGLATALQTSKKSLYDGAILALHQEVDATPITDQRFKLFFEEVFSKLTATQ